MDIKNLNIYELLKNSDYVIILDTNILLDFLRLPKSMRNDNFTLLENVKEYLFLPSTVKIEFDKQYKIVRKDFTAPIVAADNFIASILNEAVKKFIKIAQSFEKENLKHISMQIMDCVKRNIEKLNDECLSVLKKNAKVIDNFKLKENTDNSLCQLLEDITYNNHIMAPLSHATIYNYGREAENKYKNHLGPGWLDNNKPAYQRYNDYIIWKEIISFAKNNKKNVIFVTNDNKEDWFKNCDKDLVLQEYLVNEFSKTNQKIIGLNGSEFYNLLKFNLTESDSLKQLVLNESLEYIKNVSEQIFDDIEPIIAHNYDSYLTGIDHIGSEGIDELFFFDYDVINYDFEIIEENIKYTLVYILKADGDSREYWGKDDDTKEVICSPEINHTFNGRFVVEIQRDLNDFKQNIQVYDNPTILEGELREINYTDWSEKDCFINDI